MTTDGSVFWDYSGWRAYCERARPFIPMTQSSLALTIVSSLLRLLGGAASKMVLALPPGRCSVLF